MNQKHYSIAIDGPAASGKSTAAKGVARKLGFLYIDTGAMYRAVTLMMINKGLDCKSLEAATSILDEIHIHEDRRGHVFLNDVDVTKRVREMDVSSQVSYACAHKPVREKLVKIQQAMAINDSVVMDGRDIGTVVLPKADLKIYQVASVEARAARRYKENQRKNIASSLEEIKNDIIKRDYIDSNRANSPLCQASDAILLDTSNLTIEEEIDKIISLFEEKVGKTWKILEK
ncbi:MAG: (d)CMP kinase [Bacilli bacterium]|jgi:cytidylate kinase